MKIAILVLAGLVVQGLNAFTFAAHLTLEVYSESSAHQRKSSISTSALNATKTHLRTVAMSDGARNLTKVCTEMGGRPSEFACLRKTHFEEVRIGGGRAGYRAYQYEVKVSSQCVVDSDRLNWAERNWYSWIYSEEDACPSHRVIRSSAF